MARRKGNQQKPSVSQGKITGGRPKTAKSLNNLKRQLSNARARIRSAAKKMGAAYFGPAAESYTLENVLSRLDLGAHINTIYSEIRGFTADRLRLISQDNMPVATGGTGWAITKREAREAERVIAQVNKRLAEARAKFGPDIVPADFTLQGVASHITDEEGLKEYVNMLKKAYTKANVNTLTSYEKSGEALTKAEYEFIQGFIDKENRRREENKAYTDEGLKSRGRLMTQTEFSLEPVDLKYIKDLKGYRNLEDRFDDVRRASKANIWVQNYRTSLDTTLANALTSKDLEEYTGQIDRIRDLIFKINGMLSQLSTPQLVEKASLYSPMFSITEVNYFQLGEAETRLEIIYDEWKKFFTDNP